MAGSDDHDAFALDLAMLPNDRFVAVYQVYDPDNAPRIAFRIGQRTEQFPLGLYDQVIVGTLAPGSYVSDASVVALRDGGFFIVWADGENLLGTRYSASGVVIGLEAVVLSRSFEPASRLGELSLTSDGRIIVNFTLGGTDPASIILDPRETYIEGNESSEKITSQTTASVVFGYGGDDTIYGSVQEDLLSGGTGADTVWAGDGIDIVLGDEGADWLYGESGKDTLRGGAEGDLLSGGGDNDGLYGDEGNDNLYGDSGNDYLDGGIGADVLYGGENDDTYILADVRIVLVNLKQTLRTDNVTEYVDQGIDTVRIGRIAGPIGGALTSYTLTANVENGVITGSDAFNLTGNNLDNKLTGNGAANVLSGQAGNDILDGGGGNDLVNADDGNDFADGGEGNDTINGGAGNDVINGDAGNDSIDGGTQNDNISGGAGNDTLLGGAGNETIDGGTDRDRMIGGAGNDFYTVDDAGDVIIEGATEGTADTVNTTLASLTIAANVERLNYIGAGTFVGIGNSGDNRFTGGGLDDRFVDVAGGNDTVSGGNGSDSMDFRSSTTGAIINLATGVHGGAAAGDLYASIEKFFGSNTQADTMTGGTGRANFSGFGGDDTLIGGSNIDALQGNAGNDSLNGLGGVDSLDGGAGNDTLRGGTGNDYFVYSAAGFGQDVITDFADGFDGLKVHSSIANNISAFNITGNGTTSVMLTQIAVPANTITLNSASAITITAADFVFY